MEGISYRLCEGKHPQKHVFLLNEIRYLLHQIDISDLPIQSYLNTVGKIMSGHSLPDQSVLTDLPYFSGFPKDIRSSNVLFPEVSISNDD